MVKINKEITTPSPAKANLHGKGKINSDIHLIVVHCSASPNGKPFKAADIHQWHLELGFTGIGYHKVIRIDGSVENGRPEYWIGAHAEPHNQGSLGICLIGTDQFSTEQLNTLETLLKSYRATYGSSLQIKGHRDLSPDLDGNGIIERNEWIKTCPGFDVADFLKARGI